MKKWIALLAVLSLAISLCACGNDPGDASPESTEPSNGIQVDQGPLNTELTLPASLFTDMTEDEIVSAAEAAGYTSCTVNKDGSVTYTMTTAKYKEILEEMRISAEDSVAALLEGDSAVPSFKDIQYNNIFSQYEVYVDSETYTTWDAMYALVFYMDGMYYQMFSGVPQDEIEIEVSFIDSESGETLDEMCYSEYIRNMEESSETDYTSGTLSETTGSTNTSETQSDTESIGSGLSVLEIQQAVELPNVCRFYVDFFNITGDVIPPSHGERYSHYEAETGKVYVDVCVAYKNLSNTVIQADEILDAVLIYGGTYSYTGVSIAEEHDRSDFTYSNITSIAPQSTQYVHFLFQVPEEIASSQGALIAALETEDETYYIPIRQGNQETVVEVSDDAVYKTEGPVSHGEIIGVEDVCEFNVEFCSIAKQVLPPEAGNWYSYYEATDGKLYVDFCIAYRNLCKENIAADSIIAAKLSYAGEYEYTGFTIIEEDSRADFTYASICSISPLTTEYLHCLFEVPEEINNTNAAIAITFTVAGNTYTYNLR